MPITHSIGLLPIDEAVDECKVVAAEGIRTIKIKVGVDPERDVEIVRRIREALGPATALCVDANCGYRTPYEAVKIIRRMEAADLIYAEQPVEGIDGLAEVRRGIGVPLMADESAWNARDVIEIAERRAADIVSIYTTKPGGLFRAMQVARSGARGGADLQRQRLGRDRRRQSRQPPTSRRCRTCRAELRRYRSRCRPSIGPGGSAGSIIPTTLSPPRWPMSGGAVPVPMGPGMGVEIDEAKIERYRVDPS